MRKTSLDELPQLFNVLKGEMSLVGPRPIITAELERYNEEVDYYLLSKPGMTGLWQVSGRSDVDYETRVYLDAWYVKNWSMWNDIAILFKTIGVVIKKMAHINVLRSATMKIIIVNSLYYPYKFGGAEVSVQLLAEGLVARGITVKVITLNNKKGNRTFQS